jgi:hypothetical protein
MSDIAGARREQSTPPTNSSGTIEALDDDADLEGAESSRSLGLNIMTFSNGVLQECPMIILWGC